MRFLLALQLFATRKGRLSRIPVTSKMGWGDTVVRVLKEHSREGKTERADHVGPMACRPH